MQTTGECIRALHSQMYDTIKYIWKIVDNAPDVILVSATLQNIPLRSPSGNACIVLAHKASLHCGYF